MADKPKVKIVPWLKFQEEVAVALERSLKWLGLDPKTARVVRKPQYYSKTREKNITFDNSIEVTPSGADRPSLLWIWECKDYPDRKVTVDEVEEYDHKATQVAAHKLTIVTRLGFDPGAIAVAKSRRIALAVLEKRQVRIDQYSSGQPFVEVEKVSAPYMLTFSGSDDLAGDLDMFVQMQARQSGLMS